MTDQERWEQAERDALAEKRAGSSRPLANLMPIPGPIVVSECRKCRIPFETESVIFQGDGDAQERTLYPNICDDCAAKEKAAPAQPPSTSEMRRRNWTKMVGTRYATFEKARLPQPTREHVERVLAWTPQTIGIGLSGPPRTGKSPLIFALGQLLYVAGVDVFPTSGIEFQREYMRGIEEKAGWLAYLDRCERSAVLLLDDADKLNLSPGVEAEYYGMFETRRNFERPVLATLNLTSDELRKLGRDRADRSAAIVERLGDVCEIIPITP